MFDPCLSDLPEDWQLRAVGSLGEVVTGTTPSTSHPEYYGGKIPFVSPGDLDAHRHIGETEKTLNVKGAEKARLLPPNAIMITCIGILGKVGQATVPVATNQQINSVILSQHLDPSFAYWVSHLLKRQLERLAGLQVIPIVNKSLFSEAVLPVPPLGEQRRIADILDTADAAVHQTEAVIAKLKQVKAGLLHDLLTRGLDENGQLRDPEAHPEQFKETEIGRVPRGWPINPLRKIATVGTGLTLNSRRRKMSGAGIVELPYLRVANVQDGYLDLSEVKTVPVQSDKIGRYLLQPGDVLMTEGGDFDKLGRGTVWRGQIQPCLHQNHVFRVTTDCERLLPEFLSAISSSQTGKQLFVRMSKQTTNLATINSTQLKAFPVPTPPLHEQEMIVAVLQAQDARIRAEEAYRDKLQQVKRGLMQDLLTGRVRV